MGEEWNGFEDGDIEVNFGSTTMSVHRATLAQASSVWKAMLMGRFTESDDAVINFCGDDPNVARLCIELIYSTVADGPFDWAHIESRVTSDRDAFDAFVDKYDLQGVKRVVAHELEMFEKIQRLECQVRCL